MAYFWYTKGMPVGGAAAGRRKQEGTMQANTFSQAEFLAAAGIGGLCQAQDDTPAFAALEGEGRAGADDRCR